MSVSYHISSSGKPALCEAEERSCPRGGQHFASMDEAQLFADVKAKANPPIVPTEVRFPRLDDSSFVETQANMWVFYDGRLGGIYRNDKSSAAYVQGFKDGISGKATASEEFPERNPDDTSARAREIGIRRGILTARASEKDFTTEPFHAYLEGVNGAETYTVRFENGSKLRLQPNAQGEIYLHALHNPFKKNDEVIIPAGTSFKGYKGEEGITKRKQRVKVLYESTSHSTGSVGKRGFVPAAITAANGKRFNLTPAILSENGKPVYEEPVMGEVSMSKDLYYDSWDK